MVIYYWLEMGFPSWVYFILNLNNSIVTIITEEIFAQWLSSYVRADNTTKLQNSQLIDDFYLLNNFTIRIKDDRLGFNNLSFEHKVLKLEGLNKDRLGPKTNRNSLSKNARLWTLRNICCRL